MEKILIKGFRANFKTYDRHEYFEIDADFNEIKFFFNKLLFEIRAPKNKPEKTREEKPEKTREEKPEKIREEKPEKKKEKKITFVGPANPSSASTALEELRRDQLETYNGVMSRKDIEDSVKDFNNLIECILAGKTNPREDQKREITTQLNNLVSKKRSKDIAEKILKEGTTGVSAQMKISKREIDALFK
jgi:hypothetical protein